MTLMISCYVTWRTTSGSTNMCLALNTIGQFIEINNFMPWLDICFCADTLYGIELGRRITNTSASEPSTGELVTHLRDLLGSALTAGSQNITYQREWGFFSDFLWPFLWTINPPATFIISPISPVYLLPIRWETRTFYDYFLSSAISCRKRDIAWHNVTRKHDHYHY